MFFPVAKREAFLDKLREKVRPGGAIIVFDKTDVTGYPATIYAPGICREAIGGGRGGRDNVKELSLGGIQRPIDPEILGDAVEWFRFGDFAGWIIEGNQYETMSRLYDLYMTTCSESCALPRNLKYNQKVCFYVWHASPDN